MKILLLVLVGLGWSWLVLVGIAWVGLPGALISWITGFFGWHIVAAILWGLFILYTYPRSRRRWGGKVDVLTSSHLFKLE